MKSAIPVFSLLTALFLSACYGSSGSGHDAADGSSDLEGDEGVASDGASDSMAELLPDIPVEYPACYASSDCRVDEFCEGPAASCALPMAPGWCQRPREDCGGIFDEVCGCDGVTYANDCERQRAGVWLDYRVACSPVRDCGPEIGPCPENYFCEFPMGGCGEGTGSSGTCVHVPETDSCASGFDPVCGCDDVTYSNTCFRRSNEVSALHAGECEARACLPGDPGAVCAPGEFCEGPRASCSMMGMTGWCRPPRDDCGIFDEVCGCDGVTYGNDCERQKAGVWLDYRVECSPVRDCGPDIGPCPENYFCEFPMGECEAGPGSRGTCVHVPETSSCAGSFYPLCGCDRVTYTNGCYRRTYEVSALHDGPC